MSVQDKARDFDNFLYFLAASAAKKCKKKTVIKSTASAASAKGGCASSRLDHGLKFYVTRGGCASSRLISELWDMSQLGGLFGGDLPTADVRGTHSGSRRLYMAQVSRPYRNPYGKRIFDDLSTIF